MSAGVKQTTDVRYYHHLKKVRIMFTNEDDCTVPVDLMIHPIDYKPLTEFLASTEWNDWHIESYEGPIDVYIERRD